MTEKITSKREPHHNFRGLIKNGGAVQLEIKPILQKLAIEEERFGLVVSKFSITIPANYKHAKQIDRFAEKVKKLNTTYHYDKDLTSKKFENATHRLVPGKTYTVKIFPILERASSKERVSGEDCMAFLRKQNAILVGGQGLTLAYSLMPDEFPVNKCVVSFDEKVALWKGGLSGHHMLPRVDRFPGGGQRFDLDSFESGLRKGYCLLCFYD